MEPNFFAPDIHQIMAPSQTTFNHLSSFSDDSFSAASGYDDLLIRDFHPFELPSPPLPPLPQPAHGLPVGLVPLEELNGLNSMPMPAEVDRNLMMDSGYRNCNRNGMSTGGGRMLERRPRYSTSGDGSSTLPFEIEPSSTVKKAMAPEKLAELAVVDPKRAKRIIANRQSAAKSKEKKMRYIRELEKRVLVLKTQACATAATVSISRRNTSDLSVNNKERKIRVDSLRQQAEIRNALSEALNKEVQSLRNETELMAAITGYPSYGGLASQFSSEISPDPSQYLLPQQPQLYMPPPPPPSPPLPPFPTQSFSDYYVPNFNPLN